MNPIKTFAVLTLVLLGLSTSALAGACSSNAAKDSDGNYTGCIVKTGDKEFVVSAVSSSEAGCKHVCDIMGEVNDSKGPGKGRKVLRASLGF